MTYSHYLFDCDGVLLNSNSIKVQGFRIVCDKYFPHDTEWLLDLHRRTNGISRYVKFRKLIKKNHGCDDAFLLQQLCDEYQSCTTDQLLDCDVASGIEEISYMVGAQSMGVISGGDQDQLRNVLTHKGLSNFFLAGIFGSPMSKVDIYEKHFRTPCSNDIYFGDSLHDREFATTCGLDFVFCSSWSSLSIQQLSHLCDIKIYPNILSFPFVI